MGNIFKRKSHSFSQLTHVAHSIDKLALNELYMYEHSTNEVYNIWFQNHLENINRLQNYTEPRAVMTQMYIGQGNYALARRLSRDSKIEITIEEIGSPSYKKFIHPCKVQILPFSE